MRDNCRWVSAIYLVSLSILTLLINIDPARADDKASGKVAAHVSEAESALKQHAYLEAATEYRKAAELSDSVEIARKATQLAFSYRFNKEAIIAAKRWVKLDSESQEARAFLGQLYFRVDDLRRSRRQFERLIKRGPEEPGERVLSLVAYLSDEGLPERADELMRLLAKPYKNSAKAHYAVAILALQAGDAEHARERAARSLELDPDNIKPDLLYARTLMFDGKQDAAIEHLAGIIGDSPQPDPDARMELALMYMLSGRDDDALSQVNQVLLEQSGRSDALRLMALINFRLERLDAAWDDFQDLLATGQYRMDALFYLARIADYRDQYERAVRLYRAVRSGANTVVSQRRASALLALELDDVDGALQLLDEFAETSPANAVEIMVAKAQLLVSLQRYEEGLELYEKAVRYRPDDEYSVLGQGEALLRLGRLDDAITVYRDAVQRWPESSLSLNALGYTLADRTDLFVEAETLIRKALQIDPDSAAIVDSLGWVLHKLGQHESALVKLERAYASLEDSEVAAHLVEVLVALERNDEALEILVSAEENDPDNEMLIDVRTRYFPETP